MFTALAVYVGVGCVAGLLAGLLGVGGGLIIVPMLGMCLAWEESIPKDAVMHMALATSMASILFTAVSSAWAHHKRGAVAWVVVRPIVPGVLAGTFLGSCIAARLSTGFLKVFFVVFLFYVAVQMLVDRKPTPSREFPAWPGMVGVGGVIGVVSSLVGIGGGTLSVPFMVWCNLPVHRAIGTSSAIGFPIAVGGTIGYLYNGLKVAGLPPLALGFVYLPALAGIVSASVLTAPLGAKLAHGLPVTRLKRAFAVLLIIMGTRMLWSVLAR
jgi:uncharacterized membrane protein YfcA